MDVLGIDLSKRTFDVTLLVGNEQHHHSFPNTPEGFAQLESWLSEHGVTRLYACMEATNVYYEGLAAWLYALGHSVSVVNPARIKGFAQATMQRNKTDKLDSLVIALFCAKHHPKPWKPTSEEQKRLRALVRYRDDLKQTRLQQQNRLEDTSDALVRRSLHTLLATIEQELKELEVRIKEHLAAHAKLQSDVSLLTSVVGISLVTAVKLLAEMPELEAYERAKAAAADAGLCATHYSSGTSVRRRSRLSKVGKASVRAALYFPAMTALRCSPEVKAFAQRLAAKGKPKKLILGAIMRKLLHICYGVLKHRTPYDPAKAFGSAEPST
jgi:transposase